MNIKHIVAVPLCWLMFVVLLIVACRNQFDHTLKPLWSKRHAILADINKTDAAKLETPAPDILALVNAVNAYPPKTRFYLVPFFSDSGNYGRDLGLVMGIVRYLCYPRIIVGHAGDAEGESKAGYLARVIGTARTWQDLDWIMAHDFQVVILIRNNKVELLPVTAPVEGL